MSQTNEKRSLTMTITGHHLPSAVSSPAAYSTEEKSSLTASSSLSPTSTAGSQKPSPAVQPKHSQTINHGNKAQFAANMMSDSEQHGQQLPPVQQGLEHAHSAPSASSSAHPQMLVTSLDALLRTPHKFFGMYIEW